MKKILLAGIVFIMGAAAAFAQAGYKDFTFGMTIEQVKKLAPDAKEYGHHGELPIAGELALIMYLYNTEIGPLRDDELFPLYGDFTLASYYSKKEKLVFDFFNNKLYGVEVVDLPDSVLGDLKTKYGDKKIIPLTDDLCNQIVDAAVWNDGKRFVVYCKYNYTTKEYHYTVVLYYDANFMKPHMEKTMQKFRASKGSRLD